MKKTLFAGLTILEAGESLGEADGAFTDADRETIDRLLHVGAKTHRHDGTAGLTSPQGPPTAAVVSSGGALAAGLAISVAYTLEDAQGGETLPSPATVVSTQPPLGAPQAAPSAVFDSGGGTLAVNTYFYAQTFTDGEGGETPMGPAVSVERPPGFASGRVELSNLTFGMAEAGAVGWRLYRAVGGGEFDLLTTGGAGSPTFIDDGSTGIDCDVHPPAGETNTTLGVSSLLVTLPSGELQNAVAINLYATIGSDFGGGSFLAQYPVSSAGTVQVFRSLELGGASPPSTNLSIGGAHQIDPDTELLDWHWKRPVAASALLGSGVLGDVKLVEQSGQLYGVLSPSAAGPVNWVALGSAGGSGSVGPQGPQGPEGPAGPKGASGASGAIGLTGPQGPEGPAGPKGASGASGAIGLTGPAGPQGASGASGAIGLTGPQGPEGPAGPKGASGASGAIGLTGPQGPQGASGASGAIGLTGPQGPEGPAGPKGASGASGAIGLTGPQGPEGPKGASGASGAIGLTGPQGPEGPAGPKGASGASGAIGLTGPQGLEGPAGPKGASGASGAIGLTGPTGPMGASGASGAIGLEGPATWTPVVGNGVTELNRGAFEKTGAVAESGKLYSLEGFTRGVFFSFQTAVTNKGLGIGLNTDPKTDEGFTGIDYWINTTGAGTIIIRESGTIVAEPGAFALGDILSITYDGITVRYWKNGELLRSVARATGAALYLDSWWNQQGGKVENLHFGPMGEAGASGAVGPQGPGLNWKEPVTASASLGAGTLGDVRLAEQDGEFYGVLGTSATVASGWTRLSSAGTLEASGTPGIVSPVQRLTITGSGAATVTVVKQSAGKALYTVAVPPLSASATPGRVNKVEQLTIVASAGINALLQETSPGQALLTITGPQVIRGVVNGAGAILAGDPGTFTVTKIGTGRYKIVFTQPFLNTPIVTAASIEGEENIGVVAEISKSLAIIHVRKLTTGELVGVVFSFMAYQAQ